MATISPRRRRGRRDIVKGIFCVLCASAVSYGEVIDRIAVTVDQQVITLSRVLEETRLAALMNGEKPDLRPEARRQAAERLVERLLIEREMELTRFPSPPPEEAARMLKQSRQGRTEAEYREALAAYQITEETLKQYLMRQAALLRFLEVRFRPQVEVSEADVRGCLQKQEPKTPRSFEEARAGCEEAVAAASVDKAVDGWLRDVRARIVYREEAFQ